MAKKIVFKRANVSQLINAIFLAFLLHFGLCVSIKLAHIRQTTLLCG